MQKIYLHKLTDSQNMAGVKVLTWCLDCKKWVSRRHRWVSEHRCKA